ncbi:MAG: hypothetical protein F6K19_39650 [Cyanothece sp. SIO1E1]|nr:hypothetical protein [Cyanothece sp. SIO1E1]
MKTFQRIGIVAALGISAALLEGSRAAAWAQSVTPIPGGAVPSGFLAIQNSSREFSSGGLERRNSEILMIDQDALSSPEQLLSISDDVGVKAAEIESLDDLFVDLNPTESDPDNISLERIN